MRGPAQRMIRKLGTEYKVKNAVRGDGDHDVPSYELDGTLVASAEQRSEPVVETDSSGEEVQATLQLRAVYDSEVVTIREAGEADGFPTRLEHPDGPTYEVLGRYPEDSGVTILRVHRA